MELDDEALIGLIQKKANRPLKFSELMKTLEIPESQRHEFRGRLKEMVDQGSMVKLRGGRYGLPDEMSLVSGVLHGHPDGYGFLITEDDGPDLYIGRKEMNGAMHKDQVLVRIEKKRSRFSRPEGRVIRILERRTQTLVGVYEPLGRDGWVIPSEEKISHDVFIPGKHRNGAKAGQVVVIQIIEHPTRHHPAVGQVTEILGKVDDPEVELRSIFHKHGVHQDFPPEALEEAREAVHRLEESERTGRRDLTETLLFTIDGERAKDFDDAVSLEKKGKLWRVGVHIADVSHYVHEGGPLDKEALLRGTSIYYPDGVIPMLPVELSNNICSLRPDEERLTLSVSMDFTEEGELKNFELFQAVIKSRFRLTYNGVWDMLENDRPTEGFEEAFPVLKNMHWLSQVLRRHRFEHGSIDFQIPEPDVQMNEDGSVRHIGIASHNQAHELIEEFMLAANQTVARFLTEKGVPQINRIHEPPDPDKLEEFREFIGGLGYKLPAGKKSDSKSLHRLLQKIRGKPESRVINTLLLRALKKAQYSERPLGHFALGFQHYSHFTSPIRRYPDLAIHRLVRHFMNKSSVGQNEKKRLRKSAFEISMQSTDCEVKAQAMEREVNDLRRAQFMADKVGQVYSGIISGVRAFGFFVELQEVFVEGLVRVSSLKDDYYNFYETEHKLKGQNRNRTFSIGDAVRVRVAEVDIPRRRIDLVPDSR